MANPNKTEYFGKTDLLFLVTLIHTEVSKYVKAVAGKGLSTEDFTTALKTRLEGIDISQYSTTDEMMEAINTAMSQVVGIKMKNYASFADLPAQGELGTIYLIPNGGGDPNSKDEYFWDNDENKYEKFGTTEIDLSDYIKNTDLVELTTDEVKAAWDAVFNPVPPAPLYMFEVEFNGTNVVDISDQFARLYNSATNKITVNLGPKDNNVSIKMYPNGSNNDYLGGNVMTQIDANNNATMVYSFPIPLGRYNYTSYDPSTDTVRIVLTSPTSNYDGTKVTLYNDNYTP